MRIAVAALLLTACMAPAPLALPLEILGPAGTAVQVRIDVPAARSATLEVTAHNVVGVESAYLTVGEARFDLAALGAHHPVGGVGIARIPLPESARGEVELIFSYEREIRDVSGFRVIDLALELDGARVAVEHVLEDPSRAVRPTDLDAIARGRRYFREETRDGGPTCGTCHADDGADLAYFAFTSHAIVVRAEHHLFTHAEASDIAAYVRSLDVAPIGRVYHPPFQPGPGNAAARGAGWDARVEGSAALWARIEDPSAWDAAAHLDTFVLPSPFEVPTWFRWLPRFIDAAWFTESGARLAEAEQRLNERGALEDAVAFQAAAITVGRTLLVRDGDHQGRVELLRYAAVKLWDWQRRHGGFEGPDRGFPIGGPAYPYEVGFAFFEAALAGALPDAWEQTASWWAAQLAVNEGRGASTGERPLNYRDVLLAYENAGADPSTLALIHLIGSREEERSLPERFGTAEGPARLLAVPLRHADGLTAESLLRRFLTRAGAFEAGGGTFDPSMRTLVRDAWASSCAPLAEETRASLRTLSPSLATELTACP